MDALAAFSDEAQEHLYHLYDPQSVTLQMVHNIFSTPYSNNLVITIK